MNTESTPEHFLRAWVDVDLGALLRNARAVARQAQRPLIPMVKADAYGLGAVPVARALEAVDPLAFGVSSIVEGAELREAGIRRPVIVFTPTLAHDLPRLRAAGLTPTLGDVAGIQAWHASGGGAWHLAIDTGMHRAGVVWNEVESLGEAMRAAPPAGAFTHFHSAELDDGSLERQEERFREALGRLPARPALVHADNSAAITRRSPSPWDCVRPGVFLYGVDTGARAAIHPEQVARFRARIIEIHTIDDAETVSYDATYRAAGPRRIATLACGYADGYRRHSSNVGRALVNGREVAVAGVVTMDMLMLDVTDAPCEVGDAATLIGADDGASLTIDAVAARAGVSPYELLTGLRQRVVRRYAHAADAAS